MRGALGTLDRAGKSAGEGFVAAGESVVELYENHLVALLRQRRAVRGAVEGDKGTGPVRRREHLAGVEQHRHRRPVGREGEERLDGTVAAAALLFVAAVLRRQDAPALYKIIITVRPAEFGARRRHA